MFIKNLRLANFRSYGALNVKFEKNFNIIYGDNAQGKTNIIEAIFLCASGRSHRTSKDIDLIKFEETGSYIKLDIIKDSVDSTIEIYFGREEKKKIKINEIPVKKIGDLIGHFNAVIFSPEDLLVIKEGPSERRRFIDITLCQLRPSYFYDLQQYMRVLAQRNTLLKEIQERKSLTDTLEVWNINLASIGSRIMKARNEFTGKIKKMAEANHYKLTDHNEKLDLCYIPSIELESFEHVKDIETAFLKKLEASLKREMARGSTLYGPQRDDYELFLNGTSLKQYGSQGQQRTAVLAIKLSEIELMKEMNGSYPVLLLDDVMSELDRKRQEYLFDSLQEVQTFITCTDIGFLKDKVGINSCFLNVKKGEDPQPLL